MGNRRHQYLILVKKENLDFHLLLGIAFVMVMPTKRLMFC